MNNITKKEHTEPLNMNAEGRATEAAEVKPVPARTPEELNTIALAIHRRQAFCDRQLERIEDARMVFMPIVFGALAHVDIATLGLVYEFMDKAGPRSVNGYPAFMSMQLLNREDAETVMQKLRNLGEAEKAALGETNGTS